MVPRSVAERPSSLVEFQPNMSPRSSFSPVRQPSPLVNRPADSPTASRRQVLWISVHFHTPATQLGSGTAVTHRAISPPDQARREQPRYLRELPTRTLISMRHSIELNDRGDGAARLLSLMQHPGSSPRTCRPSPHSARQTNVCPARALMRHRSNRSGGAGDGTTAARPTRSP